MPYTVTRQIQWPDGDAVVEVSAGGRDYSNPDALMQRYEGEFEEFLDPALAAEAAIAICRAWRRDGRKDAKVAWGSTGGMTLPFDPSTFRALRRWAKAARKRLPTCDGCGDLLPQQPYRVGDHEEWFCHEYCAERFERDLQQQESEVA